MHPLHALHCSTHAFMYQQSWTQCNHSQRTEHCVGQCGIQKHKDTSKQCAVHILPAGDGAARGVWSIKLLCLKHSLQDIMTHPYEEIFAGWAHYTASLWPLPVHHKNLWRLWDSFTSGASGTLKETEVQSHWRSVRLCESISERWLVQKSHYTNICVPLLLE